MAAMERNGWELSNVLDGAVPGEAVVEIRNHAKIDAVHAGVLKDILNDAAFTGRGEEDLVNELLTRVLEERVECADDIAARGSHVRRGTGKFDEALEGVAEVADALKVMTQRMCFCAGADDEHVARVLAALESAVHQSAIDEPARAQRNGDQNQGQHYDAAGNIFGANEIESAGKQQARGEADLNSEALLMQERAQTRGCVEMQAATGNDQSDGETTQQAEKEPHGAALKQRSVVERTGSIDGAGVTHVDSGGDGGNKDREKVKRHPKLDFALRVA